MFETNSLSGTENIIVILITIICVYLIFSQFQLKSIYGFGSPLTIMSLTILYYCIIGPVLSVWNGDTTLRSIDHRDYYLTSWIGTLVFLTCFLAGYSSVSQTKLLPTRYKTERFNIIKFKNQVFNCYVIGLACFVLLEGTSALSGIAFWRKQAEQSEAIYEGGLAGYVQNGFDFMIIACPGLIYLYKKKQLSLVLTSGMLFVAFALFISSGFRWRLVIAALCSLSMWYLSEGKKVKIIPLAVGGFGFLILMGVMEVTRSYGSGLDFEKGKEKGLSGYFASAFNETAVFKASGFVMEAVDKQYIPFIGLDPVVQSVVTPIPRALWPSKPTGDYLKNISKVYETNIKNNGMGQAILSYGEYYMMFGWLSIVFMSFLIGLFYAKVHKPIFNSENKELNPWYVIFCLLNGAYVYVVVSRGYTPQQTMFYFFTVYPAWYFYRKSAKIGVQ